MDCKGVSRGRKTTTIRLGPVPKTKVNRKFKADAPDQLWVANFTDEHTATGTTYATFVTDVFARKIVGWRFSTSMTTSFVLDALNQAICKRRRALGTLTYHSDRGMQYLSVRYAERLAEAGIDISIGSVGNNFDNALAETVIRLFKKKVVKQIDSWKTTDQLEWEAIKWLHWYNKGRLHGAISCQKPKRKGERVPPTKERA